MLLYTVAFRCRAERSNCFTEQAAPVNLAQHITLTELSKDPYSRTVLPLYNFL